MTTRGARFLLRLPAGLYERLRRESEVAGASINEFCVRRLSMPISGVAAAPDAARVIEKARAQFGDRLLGVVVHGSWARGEATPQSDVDILIVVDSSLPLTRELYRAWDQAPVRWEGRCVDAHFVHLPPARPHPGVWCDVAIDGRVLFENGEAVMRGLLRVRQAIAQGRLARRDVHGQRYWIAA